jgi:hypothetical protein
MSQLYMQVAEVIEKWIAKKGGLKTLAFAKNVRQNAAVYSLSAETLKYKPTLEALLQSAGAATAALRLEVRPALLLVMSYDLLFGHGKIDGGGKVKRLLCEHEAKLRTELARLKGRVGARSDCELLPAALRAQTAFPRFVRVNTLLATVSEVVAAFQTDGFSFSAELLMPGQFPTYVFHVGLPGSIYSNYACSVSDSDSVSVSVSCISFFVSCFLFLVSCFLFLVSCLLFLVSCLVSRISLSLSFLSSLCIFLCVSVSLLSDCLHSFHDSSFLWIFVNVAYSRVLSPFL